MNYHLLCVTQEVLSLKHLGQEGFGFQSFRFGVPKWIFLGSILSPKPKVLTSLHLLSVVTMLKSLDLEFLDQRCSTMTGLKRDLKQ